MDQTLKLQGLLQTERGRLVRDYVEANDREQPYLQEKPFGWIRGYQTGGRSLLWGRQCYRWSDLDFEANKNDGHGTDWPIRYRDIEPWYDYVEEFAGISGNADHIPQLPDGKFLPAMEMNCVEKEVKARIEKAFPNRRMIIGRAAHLTEPKPIHLELGRGKCQYRNQCHRGCSFGAYFSSLSATLPAAERTENLQIVNDSIVKEVLYDRESGRASGVRIIDRNTLRERDYHARVIFLCASTIGTTQIMLNSTSERFPNGIANSSGRAVQRYVESNWAWGHRRLSTRLCWTPMVVTVTNCEKGTWKYPATEPTGPRLLLYQMMGN